MMPILSTTPHIRSIVGSPPASVRVRNLSSTTTAGTDAWGRPGRPQPCFVSCEISFVRPFNTSTTTDRLGQDTVHYGLLSKEILSALDNVSKGPPPGFELTTDNVTSPTLREALEHIWHRLTGLGIDGNVGGEVGETEGKPFLHLEAIRFMSVTLFLPKASLLGEGVSLTASGLFGPFAGVKYGCIRYALDLRLHNLRVPTLIGVNPNERTNKQVVVADIGLGNWVALEDMYTDLERGVVQVCFFALARAGRITKDVLTRKQAMSHSSFETLEALGSKLSETLFRDVKFLSSDDLGKDVELPIRITMEKPTAVTFADCPIVEMRTSHGGNGARTAVDKI
jgi:dihydroneopterin aldolase